jgi:hypothetical protein
MNTLMFLCFQDESWARRSGAAGARRRGATGRDLVAAWSIPGMVTRATLRKAPDVPQDGPVAEQDETGYVTRAPGRQAANQGCWGARWCRGLNLPTDCDVASPKR